MIDSKVNFMSMSILPARDKKKLNIYLHILIVSGVIFVAIIFLPLGYRAISCVTSNSEEIKRTGLLHMNQEQYRRSCLKGIIGATTGNDFKGASIKFEKNGTVKKIEGN